MTKTEKAIPGTWYTITCTAAATVTQQIDGETAELATLSKSGTTTFRPSASTITVETDGKYHILPTKAPAASSIGGGGNAGGGASITLDAKPTSGGTNGVTSGGIYDADLHVSLGTGSMAVGKNAVANNAYSVAMGEGAVTGGYYNNNSPTATLTTVSTNRTSTSTWSVPCFSTAVGYHATAANGACTAYGAYARAGSEGSTSSGYYATASGSSATASGYSATASGSYATASGSYATASGSYATADGTWTVASGEGSGAIGAMARNSNDGCTVISALVADAFSDCSVENAQVTQLYLIAAGSPLSVKYCGGEAGLGYVTTAKGVSMFDSTWNIIARGTKKLSELLNDNTDTFAPSMKRERETS